MTKKERVFVAKVWDYYETRGRHVLPWRLTHDPYLILVSELMLQQTQVERVIPKYEAFIKRWPTVQQLAVAPLREVLTMWQGLGYNRRAKFLWECAKAVETRCDGVFPDTEAALRELPGIGPYTASAICAFAYNQPVVLIETNVRQVVIFHFFKDHTSVTDAAILQVVERTLPVENAREWYAALMDYGTHLKRVHGNLARQSKVYKKQSTFKGSDRQIRGAIIRELTKDGRTAVQLHKALSSTPMEKIKQQLKKLEAEQLVAKVRSSYILGN